MNNIDIFFALIKNEITGAALNIPSDVEVNAIDVLRIAKKQDLAHLVADALIRNGIVTYRDKIYKSVLREKLIAYYRDVHRTLFYKTVAQTLTENGIRYVPMKGILLCKLYAEPWMRNSCDLDILI